MLQSKTRWIVQNCDQDKVKNLAEELKISPLVSSMLLNRGIETSESARSFLFGGQDFHDPFLLDGMDRAVARIKEAIASQEPILIYGDYDADGVSSTAVLMMTLKELGANVGF